MSVISVAIFILLCLGLVIFFYYQNQALKDKISQYMSQSYSPPPVSTEPISPASPSGSPLACTTEAKICPDGSSVGRTGPNCEFAACPASPVISNIKSGQKIVSPLSVKGTVPPGWMFEGTFPLKLLDSKGVVVAQGQAKENIPGSWQLNKETGFTATLTFDPPASGSGKIRLENDNPSGLPENNKKFELPISF